MSISSQGSIVGVSTPKSTTKMKAFGHLSRRKQLALARKTQKPRKGKPSLVKSIVLDPEPQTSTSNIVFDIVRLQTVLNSMANCSKCRIGKLQITAHSLNKGSASKLFLKCNSCDSSTKFMSSGPRYSREKIQIGSIMISTRSDLIYSAVLGARIIGVGWAKLHLYHGFLNIPGPLTSRNFGLVQAEVLKAAKSVAEESMLMAVAELRLLYNTPSNSKNITTVGTFDGAYQQRSGKSGGGFSRYCFAAAIIAETGKVVSYGVACNSCAFCTETNNQLRDSIITTEQHEERIAIHASVCPAEYADYSSVHLESAIAPKVISDALERGIVFSGIVSDGDNKTHEALLKADVYGHLESGEAIERFECISHVAKRMKSNLNKRQEKVLKNSRSSKA